MSAHLGSNRNRSRSHSLSTSSGSGSRRSSSLSSKKQHRQRLSSELSDVTNHHHILSSLNLNDCYNDENSNSSISGGTFTPKHQAGTPRKVISGSRSRRCSFLSENSKEARENDQENCILGAYNASTRREGSSPLSLSSPKRKASSSNATSLSGQRSPPLTPSKRSIVKTGSVRSLVSSPNPRFVRARSFSSSSNAGGTWTPNRALSAPQEVDNLQQVQRSSAPLSLGNEHSTKINKKKNDTPDKSIRDRSHSASPLTLKSPLPKKHSEGHAPALENKDTEQLFIERAIDKTRDRGYLNIESFSDGEEEDEELKQIFEKSAIFRPLNSGRNKYDDKAFLWNDDDEKNSVDSKRNRHIKEVLLSSADSWEENNKVELLRPPCPMIPSSKMFWTEYRQAAPHLSETLSGRLNPAVPLQDHRETSHPLPQEQKRSELTSIPQPALSTSSSCPIIRPVPRRLTPTSSILPIDFYGHELKEPMQQHGSTQN